jgi:hypothetical protein
MKWILQKWDFLSAALLAVLGALFLPATAVKDVTTELIAFFSIQSAVILPAMIFTAGILKPDGLELADAERYHKALKAQMLFWVVLLGLDFVAVVSLIVGKAVGWSLEVPLPGKFGRVDLIWLLLSVFVFAGALAVFRTIPFVRGVLSLLDLNSDMTTTAIKRRNRLEKAERDSKVSSESMNVPAGYGKVIESKPADEQ